jgi:excisionase family DNA binding protein
MTDCTICWGMGEYEHPHNGDWHRCPRGCEREPPNAASVQPPSTDPGRLTIPAHEAAHLLGLSEKALYAAVRRREVPARRVGRRLLFHRPTLVAWLSVPVRDIPHAQDT